MDFFASQEREVTFSIPMTPVNSWAEPVTEDHEVRGLVSLSPYGIDPAVMGVTSATVRVFLKKAFQAIAYKVTVGSFLTVDGVEYEVSKVDARGTLPGRYPIRIEGIRK